MTNHPAKEKKEQEKEESIEDSSPRVTAMLPEDPSTTRDFSYIPQFVAYKRTCE